MSGYNKLRTLSIPLMFIFGAIVPDCTFQSVYANVGSENIHIESTDVVKTGNLNADHGANKEDIEIIEHGGRAKS